MTTWEPIVMLVDSFIVDFAKMPTTAEIMQKKKAKKKEFDIYGKF